MLARLPLWMVLNAYAFLLDALALAFGVAAWFLIGSWHPFWGWTCASIAAVFAFAGVKLHCTYPVKKKTYFILLRRNEREFHRSSFRVFMSAPCYRLVVRTVLSRLGKQQEYKVIFKDVWGEFSPFCSTMPAKAVIFKNAEEGRKWFEENRVQED